MILRCHYTIDDFLAFNRHRIAQQLRRPRVRLIRWGLGLGLIAVTTFLYWLMPDSPAYAFVAGVAYMLILQMVLVHRNVAKQVRAMLAGARNVGVFGDIEFEIRGDRLWSRTHVRETSMRFEAIERVEIIPDYTFVYVTPASAHIIRRDSVTTGNYESFVEEVRTRWEREAHQ